MIYFIIGGARSGKSQFAESKAAELADEVSYVATATAGDQEMAERIKHHQQSRPGHWRLVEEPLQLAHCVSDFQPGQVVIIDCLTLWLSNWLTGQVDASWRRQREKFLAALAQSPAEIILVSNEVGSGIVPLGELSRRFADEAGWLNQAVAKLADEVTLVVAGYPLSLKSNPVSGVAQ